MKIEKNEKGIIYGNTQKITHTTKHNFSLFCLFRKKKEEEGKYMIETNKKM